MTSRATPIAVRSLLAGALFTASLVAGCGTTSSPTPGSTGATASPSAIPSMSSPPSASASPSGSASSSPGGGSPSVGLPGQTDTDWGRIWDALPGTFPVFPGQEPTETGEGPFSAELAIPADPAAAATWYQGALELVGFSTFSMSGPLEDGSFVIESTGDPEGCRAETRLAPHGEGTLVSVLLAAACPFG